MRKENTKTILVLIIAIIINFAVFYIAKGFDFGKVKEFFENNLNIKVEEINSLQNVEEDDKNDAKEVKKVESNLYVHFIDIGQGDAILIENKGHYMLIDAGPSGSKSTLLTYLQGQKINKLDYVIATHSHEDHIGGMTTVINNFKIDNMLMSKDVATTKTYENMVKAAQNKKIKFYAPKVSEKFDFMDSQFVILADGNNSYEGANNHSIVIKMIFGENSIIFTGDAETEVEKDIINAKLDIKADVIKLGHHGSYTSSSENFIKQIDPDYAVISVGKNNSYGHPCKSTMQLMKNQKIKVYRTDEASTIILESDGKNIKFNVQPGSYSFISSK